MNTKMRTILSATLAAAVFGAVTSWAATENAAAPLPAVAPAAPAAVNAATNAMPPDLVTTLFGDPVIAKGKGVEVKRSQLDAEILRIKTSNAARGQTLTQDQITSVEPRVLSGLIAEQLVLANATAADKAQGKAEFEKAVQQTKTAGKLTDADFDKRLNQQLQLLNISRNEWEKEGINQRTMMDVLKRELNITVTDADAQEFYRTNAKAFEVPEEVHVRHILMLTIDPTTKAPLPDDQIKKKRQQMDDILKQLRSGADFAKLAGKYSEDPGTKDDGGELPPFARAVDDPTHAMVPEFEAAAFALTNNQISDVITTQYGYHIIQLLDKTPAHKLALTDKVPSSDTTVLEAVKNTIEQQKLAELAPDYLKKLNKDAGVEILDPTLKPLMTDDAASPLAMPAK
jgi:peptidyl-prolyl cis-trans isomerase C